MKHLTLKHFIIFILLGISITVRSQKFDGLAITPPMGWNSWNHFACDVDENLIREVTDFIVSSGMKDAGYTYVNIDDCWHGKRDSLGFIHPDPERFPSGMKALADYIHSKGLKLGIYSDAGWKTCGGYPGSRGREYQDAMQYAKWGIDYLKYDWCNTAGLKTLGAYLTMRDALYEAGRPIVLSICEWGNSQPWEWADTVGHLWRTTGDIYNCFDCEFDHGTWSSWGMLQILDMHNNDTLRIHAGPSHWNDPDMMEVGNGMSVNEDRTHFSMWCMLAAPLLAGNDIRKMTEETKSILTNKEAIAINQDSMGIQGFKYDTRDSLEIWFKPLLGGDWGVCFLNRTKQDKELEFNWKSEKVVDKHFGYDAQFETIEYSIKDVWRDTKIKSTKKSYKRTVPAHDVVMLRLRPKKKQ